MPAPKPSPTPHSATPKQRRLALIFRACIGIVALALASGFAFSLYKTKAEPPATDTEAARLNVTVVTARSVDAPRVWRAFGTARAKSSAQVGAEVSGVVEERPQSIDPGRTIGAGDLIVRLESQEYRDRAVQTEARTKALEADLDALVTELESMQETLELAEEAVTITENEIERFEDARSTAGINQIEIDRLVRQLTEVRRQRTDIKRQLDLIPSRRARLEAQIAQENASLRLAQLNVQRTEVRAPIDGVLQTVSVDDGERVAPGQPIARIVDLSSIEIPVRAPVSAAAYLAIGDNVTLTTGARGAPTWTGTIERIAPEASETTRTMTVFVVVEQSPTMGEQMLLPGQYLTAMLSSATSTQRVVIPRSSIEDDRVVVIDSENRAQYRNVDIAYHLDTRFPDIHPTETQWSSLRSGLRAGDRVVLGRTDAITPGMLLQAQDATDPVLTGTAQSEEESASTGDPS